MNVYDTANKLAQEIITSEEYTKFKQAKKQLDSNNELKTKIDEFEEKLAFFANENEHAAISVDTCPASSTINKSHFKLVNSSLVIFIKL